jgi:pyruvate ferredoxin oxidoreductase beta subunit
LFENAAAVASGVEAALKKLGKKGTVIALAGDGGTYDIGLQALSGMIDRGHNVLYVCYDNECYANTGVQRSSATPYAAWTTTSPRGKVIGGNKSFKKPIAEMVAAQGAPYVAVSSLGYPKDIEAKVKKALSIEGPKFMLIHAPCPLSWKFDNSQTFSMARAAVESGMWAMYEIENGAFRITYEPSRKKSIAEYLKAQGRFKDISEEEIKIIEAHVDKDWARYRKMQDAGKK